MLFRSQLDCTLFVRALQSIWIALRGENASVNDLVAKLRAWTLDRKGHLIVQRAPQSPGARLDAWGASQADRVLMQRLKAKFDPQHILNPGVFDGEIEGA